VRTAPAVEDAPRVEPAAVAVLEAPPAPLTTYAAPRIETDDFDAEYLAICEAIARDGRADYEDEPEDEIVVAAASAPRDAIEDIWWLPAPRVRYLLLMLVYVAISAAVGSDPVTLAADGVRALTTVDGASDFVLLAWALCGAIVVLPLGGLAVWLVSKLSLGKLRAPRFESAGWGIRLLATSAFIAGAVLYTPDALALALDTDYPVAAVSSDSMSPALHEGELVFLRGVDHPGELKVGDIIAFKYNGGLAVRRVVGFENDAIVTQADAAPNEHVLVKLESIAGKAIHLAGTQVKLPLLGNISLLGERTVDPVGSPLSSLP
jgi:signal peptidase I